MLKIVLCTNNGIYIKEQALKIKTNNPLPHTHTHKEMLFLSNNMAYMAYDYEPNCITQPMCVHICFFNGYPSLAHKR